MLHVCPDGYYYEAWLHNGLMQYSPMQGYPLQEGEDYSDKNSCSLEKFAQRFTVAQNY
jgi:hypothetical protein